MTTEEKFRKLEFLNLLPAKRGSFCVDPQTGQCGYRDGGAVFPVPDEYISELFDLKMKAVKLRQQLDDLDDTYLDGAIVRKYDTDQSDAVPYEDIPVRMPGSPPKDSHES